MFNHLSDAHDAAMDLLAAVLGEDRPTPDAASPGAGLARRLYRAGDRPLGAHRRRDRPVRSGCATAISAEVLDLQPDGSASSDDGHTAAARRWRAVDGPPAREPKLAPAPLRRRGRTTDVAGRYRCEELDAELTVTDAGGVLYGGFSGFLGQGRMELLDPVGPDVWALPCPRALDHTPPGDWTLAFRRDQAGRVAGVEVGCWLARRLPYERVAACRGAG